jgi:hypothetical protein
MEPTMEPPPIGAHHALPNAVLGFFYLLTYECTSCFY